MPKTALSKLGCRQENMEQQDGKSGCGHWANTVWVDTRKKTSTQAGKKKEGREEVRPRALKPSDGRLEEARSRG